MSNLKRIGKYTSDDFHPSIGGDQVIVSLNYNRTYENFYVSAWGDDDYGFELEGLTRQQAEAVYSRLENTEDVTINLLKEMGFKNG